MTMRLAQIGPMVLSLGVGGFVRYLAMRGLCVPDELSRYRPTDVALRSIASTLDIVQKAAILALKRLPGRIQTIAVHGRHICIAADINHMDVYVHLKQCHGTSIRIAVNATRSSVMGKAAVDTILDQTCLLARKIALALQMPEAGQRPGPERLESVSWNPFPGEMVGVGLRREAAA